MYVSTRAVPGTSRYQLPAINNNNFQFSFQTLADDDEIMRMMIHRSCPQESHGY